MKIGEQIIAAAKKQAEGEIEVHKTNIAVYQTMPAGIGEHSDVVEAVMDELDKMAAAYDRLEMIEKYFSLIVKITVYKTDFLIYNTTI